MHYAEKLHLHIVNFFSSQNGTNMNKRTCTGEKYGTEVCHSVQIDICKKYHIHDNKHSGLIQIKEQYSPGTIKLTLRPQCNFSWVSNC